MPDLKEMFAIGEVEKLSKQQVDDLNFCNWLSEIIDTALDKSEEAGIEFDDGVMVLNITFSQAELLRAILAGVIETACEDLFDDPQEEISHATDLQEPRAG